MPSSTASEPLVNQLWYSAEAKFKRLFFGDTPRPTARPSPIAKLPQEVVEIIISYFIYDVRSLLACSMTCYSWYAAAAPHLHHTLTTDVNSTYPSNWIHPWVMPLQKSYELGLLPFVKRFRIRMVIANDDGFDSKWLSEPNLRYFSSLTNLQELGIDYLRVPSFMPIIQQCFGHFSPTLRFLALKQPIGSCRQILYFIGLFPNLQDLKIHYPFPEDEEDGTADTTLLPPSVPPLHGRLTLTCFTRENLVKHMIVFFGGLRFRHMDLFRVKCVQLLLSACADTLEVLRLYPSDPYVDNDVLLQNFNLSRNKCLRTLETTAESINAAGDAASDFLKTVLSSITSSAPPDFVVVYQGIDLSQIPHCSPCDSEPVHLHRSWRKPRNSDPHFQHQFRVFREMHSARDFHLVLCVDIFDCIGEYGISKLERIVKAEGEIGGLDYLLKDPLIIFERRMFRTCYVDQNAGWSRRRAIPATAL